MNTREELAKAFAEANNGNSIKEDIKIIFDDEAYRSLAFDGDKEIGECEISVAPGIWTITHTGVRTEYEGRGIAGKLVECIITEARKRNVKIIPQCPYANHMMSGKDEYKDVL